MKRSKRLDDHETRIQHLEALAGIQKPEDVEPSKVLTDVQGIDVYWRTGDIDWEAAKADGVVFAVLKATEGEGYLDDPKKREWFLRNSMAAHSAGIAVMYYHFARMDTGRDYIADAQAEARDFSDALTLVDSPAVIEFQEGRTAAVWLDLEKTADNLTPEQGMEWCKEFLETFEQNGPPCGLYTSKRYLEKEVGKDMNSLLVRDDQSLRGIWVARYGQNLSDGEIPDPAKYPPDEKVPEAWGTNDIWQYGSKVPTDGVPQPGDRNIAARFRVIS